jgi:hypothetical protein
MNCEVLENKISYRYGVDDKGMVTIFSNGKVVISGEN